MDWQIEISANAGLALSKLDEQAQLRLLDDLREFIVPLVALRKSAFRWKDMTTNFWPFRCGKYSLLCHIHNEKQVVEVVEMSIV